MRVDPPWQSTVEGTRIAGQQGESLNSKSEWHQPRIIRNVIVSGGAEMVAGRGGVVFLDGGDGGRAVGGVQEAAGEHHTSTLIARTLLARHNTMH